MSCTTIDDVIDQLAELIREARASKSRLGYFPALYRRVTIEVKEGIKSGRFQNGVRMEALDVRFANRYLDALETYQTGGKPSKSWEIAFRKAEDRNLTILQQLLLGMNAHINLDLGIAAAETAPGNDIYSLETDFIEINLILSSLVDDVQKRIAKVSPWVRIMDFFGMRKDELIADFSMKQARTAAWKSAVRIASLQGREKEEEIDRLDKKTALFARLIQAPKLIKYRLAMKSIGLAESKDVTRILDQLA
jgi:hypothetical protein